MSQPSELFRISSLAELDALIGEYVLGEKPLIHWEDSHGYFQFHSEVEARQALSDPYFQRFLPPVDWARTAIREVREFRPYSSDGAANWRVAEASISKFGPMVVAREGGRWRTTFGSCPHGEAKHPTVSLCLAALVARGIRVLVNQDRIDAELERGVRVERRFRGA